jgi:hypothetical protein
MVCQILKLSFSSHLLFHDIFLNVLVIFVSHVWCILRSVGKCMWCCITGHVVFHLLYDCSATFSKCKQSKKISWHSAVLWKTWIFFARYLEGLTVIKLFYHRKYFVTYLYWDTCQSDELHPVLVYMAITRRSKVLKPTVNRKTTPWVSVWYQV